MSFEEQAAETSPDPEVSGEEVYADEYAEDAEVTEDADNLESEDQPEEPVDDSEEIEFNQKQYKLPKEIASAVKDMQKDYTVKTQSLAEQRKTFEAQSQFQQQHIQEFAKVVALNDSIAEFEKIDWNALSQEDPVKAQQLFFHKSSLESQRNQLAQTISQKNQQLALEKQQDFAKRIEESESVLKRDIKDWSPELESKLLTFASSNYNVDAEDFKSAKANPSTMKLLYDAYVGKQIIQKQMAKPKPTAAKPVTTLSAKGTKVHKDPSAMSDSEFAAWRRGQIKRRGT